MGNILTLLLGPGKDIFAGARSLIAQFTISPEKKLEAERALLQMEADYQAKVMDAASNMATQQAGVIRAESASASYLAQTWRPILMLTFTFIIAFNYVIAPLFTLAALPIVPDMWELLRLGIGGYIAGRTLEKITPAVTSALTAKKD